MTSMKKLILINLLACCGVLFVPVVHASPDINEITLDVIEHGKDMPESIKGEIKLPERDDRREAGKSHDGSKGTKYGEASDKKHGKHDRSEHKDKADDNRHDADEHKEEAEEHKEDATEHEEHKDEVEDHKEDDKDK